MVFHKTIKCVKMYGSKSRHNHQINFSMCALNVLEYLMSSGRKIDREICWWNEEG